ncbi:MAG: hypothetical protein GC151_04890 [Betaproteobacteria bacterium]|nr:hypothetical protein [Betaproteobacteria bacterium]
MRSTSTVAALALLGTIGGAACAAPEAPATDVADAVTSGRLTFDLRPRLEYVDQDGKTDEATAFTNRTLLGWRTRPLLGLSVYAEAINVARIGDQNYNDAPTGSAVYPTVADPENTDVNQLYVDYDGLPGTRLRVGRMSVKLDNVRFVGNVEFRQVMQVFNGAMVENHSLPGVELQYAHFQRVKNIFTQQRQTRTDLFRAAWSFRPDNRLTAYAYFQDQPITGQATGFADNSNRIVGLRADGRLPVTPAYQALYTAEYAKQSDYAGGDPRIDASYWHLGAGVQRDRTYVRLDQERLGSNNGLYGFQTPLGTNHLFQGWADQFLTTPAQGIHDTYVTAGTAVHGVGLQVAYHDFRSDVASIRYGSEWDAGVTYAFLRNLTGKFELARFSEGDVLAPAAARKRDTTKVWLTLVYSY